MVSYIAENMMGGISTYIDAIVPHVGLAVVVDTGSTDNTLPILLKKREQYPHLYVFSAPFGTFAKARNTSMLLAHEIVRRHHLPISHLMLLDADEKLDAYNLHVLNYTLGVMQEQQQISAECVRVAHNTSIHRTGVTPHTHVYTDTTAPRCPRAFSPTPAPAPTQTAPHALISSALSTTHAAAPAPSASLPDAECECVFVPKDAAAEVLSRGAAAVSSTSPPSTSPPPAPSALTLPPSALPLALLSSAKFSITNVDSAGRPVPRMNAGLMNPRVLPCAAYSDPLPLIHAAAQGHATAGIPSGEVSEEKRQEDGEVQETPLVTFTNPDSSDIYAHFLTVLPDIVDYASPLRITMPRACGQRACPCVLTLASPYAHADADTPAPSHMLFSSVCFVDMVQEKRFERLVGSTVLITAHTHTNSDADSSACRVGSVSWRTHTWPLPKCAYAKDLPAPASSAHAPTAAALSALHQCARHSSAQTVAIAASTQTPEGAAASTLVSPDTASVGTPTGTHASPPKVDVDAGAEAHPASSCACRVPLVNFLHFVPPTAKRQAKNRAYQGAALADSLKTQRVTASLVANLPKEVHVRVRWCLLRARQRLQRWCRALLRAVEGEGDGNIVGIYDVSLGTHTTLAAASAESLQEVRRLLGSGNLDQYAWPGLLGAVTAVDAIARAHAPVAGGANGVVTVAAGGVAVPPPGPHDAACGTDSSAEAEASARACSRRVASARARPRSLLAHTLAAYSLFSCVNVSAAAAPLAHALDTPPRDSSSEDGAPVQPAAAAAADTVAMISAPLPSRVRWVDDLGAFCIDSGDAYAPANPTDTATSNFSPWLLDLCGGRPLHAQYAPVTAAMQSEAHTKRQKVYTIKTAATGAAGVGADHAEDVSISTLASGLPALIHPAWCNAAVRCVSVGAGHALCLTWAAQPCDVAVCVPLQSHTPLPHTDGPQITSSLSCTVPGIPGAVLYTLPYACVRIWSPLRDMYRKLATAATAVPTAESSAGPRESTVLNTAWVHWRGVSHLIGIVDTHAQGGAAMGVVGAAADPLFAACAAAADTLTMAHLALAPSISALSTPAHAHASALDAPSPAVDAKAKRAAAQAWCPALPSLSAAALKAQGLVGVRSAWRALQGEDKFHQPARESASASSVGAGERAGVAGRGEGGGDLAEASEGILTQFTASTHVRDRLAQMHMQRQSLYTVDQHTAHVPPYARSPSASSPVRADEVVCVMAPQAAFAMSAAVVATADGTLWFYEY